MPSPETLQMMLLLLIDLYTFPAVSLKVSKTKKILHSSANGLKDTIQSKLFDLWNDNQATLAPMSCGCITVSWQHLVTFALWFALARGRLLGVVASLGKTVLLQPLVLHGIFCTNDIRMIHFFHVKKLKFKVNIFTQSHS